MFTLQYCADSIKQHHMVHQNWVAPTTSHMDVQVPSQKTLKQNQSWDSRKWNIELEVFTGVVSPKGKQKELEVFTYGPLSSFKLSSSNGDSV